MSSDYAWEKLHSAVLGLVGLGSLQERLSNVSSYSFLTLRSEDFPENLQSRFNNVVETLEGDRAMSLSDVKAQEVAEEIVSIYDELAQIQGAKYQTSLSEE